MFPSMSQYLRKDHHAYAPATRNVLLQKTGKFAMRTTTEPVVSNMNMLTDTLSLRAEYAIA